MLSVVTFAVDYLKVKHGPFTPVFQIGGGGADQTRSPVIVVGHSNCGGAAACVEAACNPPPADLLDTPLYRWLTPLANLARSLGVDKMEPSEALSLVVKENVRQQVKNISEMETIKKAWAQNRSVQIHGWVYDLPTGKLSDLGMMEPR